MKSKNIVLPGIRLFSYRNERGVRTALLLGQGPKWIKLGLIEADGYRRVSVPATEIRWMHELPMTEFRRQVIRQVAKRVGTNPRFRRELLDLTERKYAREAL